MIGLMAMLMGFGLLFSFADAGAGGSSAGSSSADAGGSDAGGSPAGRSDGGKSEAKPDAEKHDKANIGDYDYDEDGEEDGIDVPSPSKKEAPKEKSRSDKPTPKGEKKGEKADTGKDFSKPLLKRAAEYGFSDEEAKAFGSPEALERAMTAMDKKIADQVRQDRKAEADKAAKPPVTDPKAQKSGDGTNDNGKKEAAGDDGPINDGMEDLDPDLWDSEAVKRDRYMRKNVVEIRDAIQQLVKFLQHRDRESFVKSFEGMVDGLGEDYHDILGRGKGHTLDKDGEPFQNRVALLEEMEALQAGYQKTGRRVPPVEELFDRAIKSLFANKIAEKLKTKTRREISDRLRRQDTQLSMPPTSREGADIDPEKRAKEFTRNYMIEHGIEPDEEEDGLDL